MALRLPPLPSLMRARHQVELFKKWCAERRHETKAPPHPLLPLLLLLIMIMMIIMMLMTAAATAVVVSGL